MDFSLQYLAPTLMTTLRYFLFAGIPFLIFYVLFPQKFSSSKIQSKLAKHKDFVREILLSIQTNLIVGVIIVLVVFSPLREYTQIYTTSSQWPIWWMPLSILFALVVHDTYFYWMHRTLHHPKLYKTVHLIHHKSINPSPWASFSFNFSEGILEAAILPIIVCLIPMHPLAIISFGMLSMAINVYGHLGFEVMPKWFRHSFLFEIMNTSVHHNLHHEKFNGNYGYYFRIWDRIMNTEHPDYVQQYDRIQERRFGTSHTSLANG